MTDQHEPMVTSYGIAFNKTILDRRTNEPEPYLWHISYVDYFKADGSYIQDIVWSEMRSDRLLDFDGSRIDAIVRRAA